MCHIQHWFRFGPERGGRGGDDWKTDPEVASIACRHDAAGDYVLLGGCLRNE